MQRQLIDIITEEKLLQGQKKGTLIFDESLEPFLTQNAPFAYDGKKDLDKIVLLEALIFIFNEIIPLDNTIYLTLHEPKFKNKEERLNNLNIVYNEKAENLNLYFNLLKIPIFEIKNFTKIECALRAIFKIKMDSFCVMADCFEKLKNGFKLEYQEKELTADDKYQAIADKIHAGRRYIHGNGSYFDKSKTPSDIDTTQIIDDLTFELFLNNTTTTNTHEGLEIKGNLIPASSLEAFTYCSPNTFNPVVSIPIYGNIKITLPKSYRNALNVDIALVLLNQYSFLQKTDKEIEYMIDKGPRKILKPMRLPKILFVRIKNYLPEFKTDIDLDYHEPTDVEQARQLIAEAVVKNTNIIKEYIGYLSS